MTGRRHLAAVSLLVHDYDEAITFFTQALRFTLLEDTPLGGDKRWVIVSPGPRGANLLLARASDDAQRAAVGRQAGGRVFLFLHTDDLDADVAHMQALGVRFAELPRDEVYGRVVVFFDLCGNKWDLIQPKDAAPTLRQGEARDAAALARFATRVFGQTYAADTAAHDLQAYCDAAFAEPVLAAELADPTLATWLAEAGDELVGYVQVARDAPRPECVVPADASALLRLYVDPAWHGRGLAARLMALARDSALDFGSRHLWLSVWERNPRAVAYYRKTGWVEVGQAEFVVGSDRQRDQILRLDLDPP